MAVAVKVVSLSAEVVANFELSTEATAREMKQEVGKLLGIPASEQRLVIGAFIFEGLQQLSEIEDVQKGSAEVMVTLVHVSASRAAAVSGNSNGDFIVWDLEQGAVVQRMEGSMTHCTCASLNLFFQQVVCGCSDGKLQIWGIDHVQLQKTIEAHVGRVTCLSMDWALMRALTGGEDNVLRLWDLHCALVMLELTDHAHAISCVMWDVNMQFALSGSVDGGLRLWDMSSGQCVNELNGHIAPVKNVEAAFDKQVAVTCTMTTVRVWWRIGSHYHFYKDMKRQGHVSPFTCMTANLLDGVIVAGSENGFLYFWSSAGHQSVSPQGQCGEIRCLATLSSSQGFLSGGSDGSLHLWDKEGARQKAFMTPGGPMLLLGVNHEPPTSASSSVYFWVSCQNGKRACDSFRITWGKASQAACRPTVADFRKHLSDIHHLPYMKRLRFFTSNREAALDDIEKLPLPPVELNVRGPDSVVQMLRLALAKEQETSNSTVLEACAHLESFRKRSVEIAAAGLVQYLSGLGC